MDDISAMVADGLDKRKGTAPTKQSKSHAIRCTQHQPKTHLKAQQRSALIPEMRGNYWHIQNVSDLRPHNKKDTPRWF